MEKDSEPFSEHAIRMASKCGHQIHDSAPTHTPWCTGCVLSQGRARLDAARKDFVARGGLRLVVYARDGRWNKARLKYCIAKQRLDQVRRQEQWRWEREREWDRAHQGHVRQCVPMAAGSKGLFQCLICASTMVSYAEATPRTKKVKTLAWWERPIALAVAHTPILQTKRRQYAQARTRIRKVPASPALRNVIHSGRAYVSAAEADSQAWAIKRKIESAFCEKYCLGEIQFDDTFWQTPISGLISLRVFQQHRDMQRMALFRSHGRRHQSRLPPSPLSQYEQSGESQIDEKWLAVMREKEEVDKFERATVRVGGEVGYLYFVGEVDGMEEWREEMLRSKQWLVVRSQRLDFMDLMD